MALKIGKTGVVALSYTTFSALMGSVLLYFVSSTPIMWGISAVSLILSFMATYMAWSMRDDVKSALAEFYKERGATIGDTVVDVSRPYRRGVLYHPRFIDRIVDGQDPYVIYPMASLRVLHTFQDNEDLSFQADLGKRVFWNVFLEMLDTELVVASISEDEEVILYLKKCRDVSPIINEICDFLRKASARERENIPYDMEIYSGAMTLKTLKAYMRENEKIGVSQSLTRFDHLGIILFTLVVGEFSIKETRDKFPPVKLDRYVMKKMETYRSTYAAASMFATVVWTLPIFGMNLFSALAAVVGFAFGYLYMPVDVYHPSIPWYNRYKVWHYIRKKLGGEFATTMDLEDTLAFMLLDGYDKRDFMLSIVVGVVDVKI